MDEPPVTEGRADLAVPHQRADEDGTEQGHRAHDGVGVDLLVGKGEQGGGEDDGDGVVEDGLTEDHREEVDLDAEGLVTPRGV